MNPQLDLITIGRVSVDLYGQQIGARLEDVSSFLKAVGGCPANIAIGAARLGLKSALISRVGNEPMGRFVLEQLRREAVDTRGMHTDPQRLTSLVLLSVQDQERFPLIFYRENCADSALAPADIDEAFVASSRAILVTGTHFSIADAARAQRKAIDIARKAGQRVIIDIDYRPTLWGIGGHAGGENRYAPSASATAALQSVLPHCDLIVGTEEELRIAGGAEELLTAIGRIREHSRGIIVCKRGPRGCVVFPDRIPARLEDGLVAGGMNVSVYNVLGAGDAFLAGFLRGYLRGESLAESARLGNACGAIAVSRLMCSAEFPTLPELNHYLMRGSEHRALREDDALNHLHWVTTRKPGPAQLFVFAVDDQPASEAIGDHNAALRDRAAQLPMLLLEAAERLAATRQGVGVLLAPIAGSGAWSHARCDTLWLARRVERPASHPLQFHGAASLASRLNEWPAQVAAACRCLFYPGEPAALRLAQERELLRLAASCRAQHRELLLEIPVVAAGGSGENTAQVLARLYEIGVRPDWWQLEPQPSAAAWRACAEAIARGDPFCRGILVSARVAPLPGLDQALQLAAEQAIVRGLAVGHTMFDAAATEWRSGHLGDESAIREMTERCQVLIDLWIDARQARAECLDRGRV